MSHEQPTTPDTQASNLAKQIGIHGAQIILRSEEQLVMDALRAYRPASERGAGSDVHTDHPLRHFDRTCPACLAESNAVPLVPISGNGPNSPTGPNASGAAPCIDDKPLPPSMDVAVRDAYRSALTYAASICDAKVFDRENAFDNGCWSCGEAIRLELAAINRDNPGDASTPNSATAPTVLAQVEAALRKNPLIAMFLDQSFWHAHHVDIVIRHDGQDRRFEADWIKDIWYIVRRRGLSATEAVRAEQTGAEADSRGTKE